MNKYLLTVAVIGFAMAGCTQAERQKEEQKKEEQKEERRCENGRISKKQSWSVRNGYSLSAYTPGSDEVAAGRKSAAQKLIEGV